MLGSGACSSDCHPRLHTEPIWPGRAQVQQSQIEIQSTIANTSANTNPYDQVLLLLLTCSHPHPVPHHLPQDLSEATSLRFWRLDPTGFGEVVVVAESAPSSSSWSRWWWNLSSLSRLRRNSFEIQAPKAGGCARGNRGDWGHKGTLGRQGRHRRHRRQGRLKKLTSGITHWANL